MSQLLTLESNTNSNHHIPTGGQVSPIELDALITRVSSAINWDMLPNAEAVKLTESPACYFVDEDGQDWEWDEPWEQTAVNVGPSSATIIFVHSHSGQELFFTYERPETAQAAPVSPTATFEHLSDEDEQNIPREDVKTLADLTQYVQGWAIEERIENKDDFNHIDDATFQAAKVNYFDTKQALRDYIDNEDNHYTPINEKREAEHGWDGINTVQFVQLVLESHGFEYGILHKSSFLAVDDAKFHELKVAFINAHYALCDSVGLEYTRTIDKPFVPM